MVKRNIESKRKQPPPTSVEMEVGQRNRISDGITAVSDGEGRRAVERCFFFSAQNFPPHLKARAFMAVLNSHILDAAEDQADGRSCWECLGWTGAKTRTDGVRNY